MKRTPGLEVAVVVGLLADVVLMLDDDDFASTGSEVGGSRGL